MTALGTHGRALEADLSRQSPVSPAGAVALVGAGAGDAGSLTLRALATLQAADVVFFDDLVDASILALIPGHVEQVFVGKRVGQPSTPQSSIHALMIAAAERGRRVVRLKGGDPFVFGRGAEEVDVLAAAGFATEVVPGLTAALVCAAATGIPLTDRRYAAQVTFVTATRADEALTPLRGLAGAGRTLVIYMGSRRTADIGAALIADGVSTELPVALIENGGRPAQQLTRATVGSMARLAGPGPALLIVGDVVKASHHV
jgi:uroporphyrin-III C-methyltransferase/precorrin-2 dehydrogenase/sirohydrochlorin ferrochelatase